MACLVQVQGWSHNCLNWGRSGSEAESCCDLTIFCQPPVLRHEQYRSLTIFTFRGWKWQCPMPILLAKLFPCQVPQPTCSRYMSVGEPDYFSHINLKGKLAKLSSKRKSGVGALQQKMQIYPFGFQMNSQWQATYLSYFLGVDYKHQGSWRRLAAK